MSGVGKLLKKVRKGKGIPLEKVAADNKLPVFYLEAIEANNWQVLPAPPYIKGYLRLYATYLGLSPDKIISQYEEEIAPLTLETKTKKKEINYKLAIIIFLIIFALFLLFFFWFLPEREGPKKSVLTTTKPNLKESIKASEKPLPAQTLQPLSKPQAEQNLPPPISEKKPVLGISVNRIYICLDIKDREPINPKTLFHLTARTPVYCFTEILGVEKPINIKHVWIYKGGAVMTTILPVRSKSWRTWSKKLIYPDLKGKWQVIILGPQKQKLASIEFTVK
jgi:transcriptional regulator with XRE-family HTH domain